MTKKVFQAFRKKMSNPFVFRMVSTFLVLLCTYIPIQVLAAPGTALTSANEAGRVLATLDDWRAIMFILIFVLVADRVATAWYRALDRKDARQMREEFILVTERLSSSVDRLTEGSSNRDQAVMLHHARIENLLSRLETYLSKKGDD